MREIQKSLGQETEHQYDRPHFKSAPKIIADYKTIISILQDSTSYTTAWSKLIRQLKHHEHILGENSLGAIKQQKIIKYAIIGPEDSIGNFSRFIDLTTKELVRNKNHKLRDTFEIDIVRNFATRSWTRFGARLFHVPVKSAQNGSAKFDDEQLLERMVAIFRFNHLNEDTVKSFEFRRKAIQANKELTKEVKEGCEALTCSSFAHVLLHRDGKSGKDDFMSSHGTKLLQRLFGGGKTVAEVTSLIVLLVVDIVVLGYSSLCQIIDLLLTEPHYSQHWPRIQELASDTSPRATKALHGYVLEALRLVPPIAPILRISDIIPSVTDWRYAQAIKKGDAQLLDIAAASRDPQRFSSPNDIKLDRPPDAYLPFNDGPHASLVREIIFAGLVAQLRVLGKLKSLKRAPGTQGVLTRKVEAGRVSFLSDAQDEWVPLPSSMKVHFDSLDTLLQSSYK